MSCRALALLLAMAPFLLAQQPGPEPPKENATLDKAKTYTAAQQKQAVPEGLGELVAKQFGTEFTFVEGFPTPLLQGDFDGDGVQDAAIVAQTKNPLGGAAQFNYRVSDPHHAYFGFGDPKVTASFNVGDDRVKSLLIIHGAGEAAWKAETPKAKFVLINVPFDRLSLGLFKLKKKKTVVAISAHESELMTSFVYFDGKKYKWEPNAMAE